MEILKVENLCKSYGGDAFIVNALNNVSLSINKGEFVCILGESGSGKSTLLNLLGALDTPTSGEIIINGTNILSKKEDQLALFRRKEIGFIFQHYNLIPVLNVEENICLPILLDNKKIDKIYINELITMLGLKKRASHLPSELSGGEQQRAAIARSLVNKPAIILADEPTGNLDSKTSDQVLRLLKLSVKKYNQTLIMITHNLEIAKIADRIIILSDGKIVENKGRK
ncbi:ABC transporter ATP-binding protein [Clostridium sp.]|uniref:ABC transporter ATP-binding protein n=1 Tax=Clostridium sp. TaxID=1506 RepID=UPI003F38F4B9